MLTKEIIEEQTRLYKAGYTGPWEEGGTAIDDSEDVAYNEKNRRCYRSIGVPGHHGFMEAVVQMGDDEERSPDLQANLQWILEARRLYPELLKMAEDHLALGAAVTALLSELPLTPAQRSLLTIGIHIGSHS